MRFPYLTEQASLTHTKYRADIDGLRAIAVISVVGFHAFPEWIKGGFIGVDIFFVISGFLISSIIFSNLENDSFSLIEFYRRRIKRIFPALITVMLASLVFGWYALLANEYKQLGKHIAGSAVFILNFILHGEIGYFDNVTETKPMLHLWSLAVEEQFYIFWPLMLALVWKRKLGFIRITLAVALLSLIANIYLTNRDATAAFYLPVSRFWELMVGGILAYVALHKPQLNNRFRNAQSLLGFILLAVGLYYLNEDRAFPGWWALLPTIGSFFLISAGPAAWANKNILSNKLLVWVGLISYPLYLWHWPLLSFTYIVEGAFRQAPIERRIEALIISVVLSWITYRLIERPIRFGKNTNLKIAGLLASMTLVGLLGFFSFWLEGIPARININPESSDVLFKEYPHPLRNNDCDSVYPVLQGAWSCLISKPTNADVAIIGDSHAHQYYQSLSNKLKNNSVLNFSVPACLPFSSKTLYVQHNCQKSLSYMLWFLKKNPSIKTVYLTGYFSYLAAGGFKFGNVEGLREARPLTREEELFFQDMGRKVLSRLISINKDVVIILDIPDVIFKPISCVKFDNPVMNYIRVPDSRLSGRCAIDKASYENRIAPYDRALLNLLKEFPSIRVFNPRPLLCDSMYCWAMKDNTPLYWNSDHLTIEGTDLVIDELIKTNPPLE